MSALDDAVGLAKLRVPFEAHQVSVLPKPYTKDSPKSYCQICKGNHGQPAAHLDYVGHAALTDRLLTVDPEWSWEPVAVDPVTGMPQFDGFGGLWIRLTVLGVTRLGYGDSQGKTGGNAVKEAIGDALRNAGMRFGAALDLWHKGDLHDAAEERGQAAPEDPADPAHVVDSPPTGWRQFVAGAKTVADLDALYESDARHWWTDEVKLAFTARKKNLSSAAVSS